MTNQNLAMLAVLFFIAVCCSIDSMFRRRNERIGTSTCGSSDGDGDTTADCGSGDGGGCD